MTTAHIYKRQIKILLTGSFFLITLLLICISLTYSHAQSGNDPQPIPLPPSREELKFEHITSEQGLSNNRVVSILQDSQGFMWFGTFDGLNRFNGYEFKIFRHDPFDISSMSANIILAIHEDHAGSLWIGTSGGGLNPRSGLGQAEED
jgi:hypothetical protein